MNAIRRYRSTGCPRPYGCIWKENALNTHEERFSAAKGEQPRLACPPLRKIISDFRGPVVTVSSLSDEELAGLLDALYQNLDTHTPELAALLWYAMAVVESRRRDAMRN